MECNTLSQRCGRLYFPIFLFKLWLFTLYVQCLLDCSCHIVALPAYDLEIFHRCCVVSVVLVFKYWWWCFQMFFIPFSKHSRWFPYVLIFTVNPVTPEPVNHTVLLCGAIFIFCDTSKFFMVVPSLKCTCIPYLWQMFLKLSLVPLVYGTTVWHFFLVDGGLCLFLVVLSGWCCCFWRMLFMVQLGYFHCLRTSSRCCSSLFNNSGVVCTVLALYIRVLITLYFDARLWLLSHCRYWSVWVGFLYTFVVKVPSGWGVTKMSRNGMEQQVQLLLQWIGWMYPLCWYVGKTQCCVTFVELQKYHPHIFSRSLEGSVQCWWLCAQRPPCKYWPQLDL